MSPNTGKTEVAVQQVAKACTQSQDQPKQHKKQHCLTHMHAAEDLSSVTWLPGVEHEVGALSSNVVLQASQEAVHSNMSGCFCEAVKQRTSVTLQQHLCQSSNQLHK